MGNAWFLQDVLKAFVGNFGGFDGNL